MKKTTKVEKTETKTQKELRKLKRVFSLASVKARYQKIGHTPIRDSYGHHGPATCLIGSFEHMLALRNGGKRMSYGDCKEVASEVGITPGLVEALEYGFEQWSIDHVTTSICRKDFGLGPKAFKEAYLHGEMLGNKLVGGLDESSD